MSVAPVLAEHIRQVYLGGNWTAVSLHDTLADVDFALAVREREGLNSIARLVVHLDYYADVIRGTIAGEPLSGKDADSWLIPLPQNPAAWEALKGEVLAKAEAFATAVEALDGRDAVRALRRRQVRYSAAADFGIYRARALPPRAVGGIEATGARGKRLRAAEGG